MKKIILFASALFSGSALMAQPYFENFDGLSVGSYLCTESANFRTWSGGGDGTAEDVQITDVLSMSPSNSIYFSSNAASGGPQDVLLDFLQLNNSGVFSLKNSFYVKSGFSGYFNIQGANTIGGIYALDVFMEDNKINLQNAGTVMLKSSYVPNTWFDMEIVANLTTGIWELIIDGDSKGKWQNTTNAVRYVDYFPLQGSQFYVDNVGFEATTHTGLNLNASTAALTFGSNFAGTNATVSLVVKNTGGTNMTSFDAELTYGATTVNRNITGLNLAPGQTTTVDFGTLTVASIVQNAEAVISNINGTVDEDLTDNGTKIEVNPIIPAAGKIVISEEGTGTWCQFCPRGSVFMDRFEGDYGSLGLWAGIAVHNNDPMDIGTYDSQLAFSGYPSSKVDRGAAVDPSAMGPSFETRLQTEPKATVEIGANYSSASRILQTSATFTFPQATTGAYKVAFVITEDNVTGTGSGYAQVNAYAGGGLGVMGGYETLPNPVPASQMVYDHVARDIRPSFGGFTGSFPNSIPQGSNLTVNYTFQLPEGWKTDDLHIIALLIAPDGTIDNAGRASISEAQSNGYESGVNAGSTVSVSELSQLDATFELYPNPATEVVNLTFQLKSESTVDVKIVDIAGKVIAARNYGNMNGASSVAYPVSDLTPGVYVVEVTINEEKITRRLVVE